MTAEYQKFDSLIEICIDGQWVPAASAQALGMDRCRIDYLASYSFSKNPPPISLTMPLQWDPDPVLAGFGLVDQLDRRPPSFLYDLVPQGQGRRLLVRLLGLVDEDRMVMPLLSAGAFNPIGALRLSKAVDFYKDQVRLNPVKLEFDGVTLDEIEKKSDSFLSHISLHAMLASGTTGVQGVAPKYLLTQDDGGKWHADLSLSDALAKSHWLVKLPRGGGEADRVILRNEAAYLSVANACGLRAAEASMLVDGMLFIRRFDREVAPDKNGVGVVHRLHQESLASLAGLRGFAPATSQNELLASLRRYSGVPYADTLEFLKRDVLNLALRNTDNHARNSAVQTTRDGLVQLTPLFDFAPMFMDPEIIPRSVFWRDGKGRRVDGWEEIIATLEVSEEHRQSIGLELRAFSEVIGGLAETAKECGVEEAVLEQCRRAIEAQATQLSVLGYSSEGFGMNRFPVPGGENRG